MPPPKHQSGMPQQPSTPGRTCFPERFGRYRHPALVSAAPLPDSGELAPKEDRNNSNLRPKAERWPLGKPGAPKNLSSYPRRDLSLNRHSRGGGNGDYWETEPG